MSRLMDRDRGHRGTQIIGCGNNKIYMELKDLIREDALKFLPAKSLYRFQGVCKEWRQKIVSPFFHHSQSNNFGDISGFFYQSGSNPPSFISLDSKAYGVPDPSLNFLPEPVDIRASSNGLVCCRGRLGDKHYYICHPVTKRWKQLPKPNNDHGSDPAVVLIFEPSLLNFVAEYKLICAFPCVDFDQGYEFEMYTSQDGSWKSLDEIYLGDVKLLPMSGVLVNGIIYWRGINGELFIFDLTIERTRILDYAFCGTLGVIGGKLCSTTARFQGLTVSELSNAYSNTMEMSSRATTWEHRHHISLGAAIPNSASDVEHHRAQIVLFAGGNCLLFKVGLKLAAYNMKTKESEYLCNAAEADLIVSYVNSLVEI